MQFMVGGIGPPGAAILLSPYGSITTATPSYTWNAVSGAAQYFLWVNDSTGIKIQQWYTAAAAGCGSGTGSCSVTPSTLLAAGVSTWWVQTWNSVGYGPWSNAMGFTFNVSPGKAALISPFGTFPDNTPTYIWGAVVGSTWYYLWVNDSTGSKFQQWYKAADVGCPFGAGTCLVTPSTPLALGPCTWWVRTWNLIGDGLWSDAMYFTVSP